MDSTADIVVACSHLAWPSGHSISVRPLHLSPDAPVRVGSPLRPPSPSHGAAPDLAHPAPPHLTEPYFICHILSQTLTAGRRLCPAEPAIWAARNMRTVRLYIAVIWRAVSTEQSLFLSPPPIPSPPPRIPPPHPLPLSLPYPSPIYSQLKGLSHLVQSCFFIPKLYVKRFSTFHWSCWSLFSKKILCNLQEINA